MSALDANDDAILRAIDQRTPQEKRDAADNAFWVVGRLSSESGPYPWEWVGAYHTRREAIAACLDDSYFVGRARLDLKPSERQPDPNAWPSCYFPHRARTPEMAFEGEETNDA